MDTIDKLNIEQKEYWFDPASIDEKMETIGDDIANFVSEDKSYVARLIFEEVFVNIVSYAYKKKEEDTYKPIKIVLKKMGSDCLLSFYDEGQKFDPTLYNPAPLDKKNIGGHGIRLIKELAKKMEYKRCKKANILDIYF